jgi:type IV secretory pathway component VirB8
MKKNNDINTADISPLVYRQAIRNVKVLTTAIVGETVVIVALVILLIALFPLKEKEVAYTIVEDATDKIVTTIKPGETYTGDQQLVDYFVKKYVKERETWDGITDHQRYRYTFDVTGDKIKDRLNTAINHYNNKY